MKEDSTAKKTSPDASPCLAVVPEAPTTKGKLLLVDDEPHVLEGLTLHLRRNYAVVARRSATDALRALATDGPFVAVISDLRMPGMDGVQFLVEVRRRAPHTCRLLLTGHGDMHAAVAAVNEAGIHRLLTKPCPPALLASALEQAIAGARESRLAASIDIVDLGAPPKAYPGVVAELHEDRDAAASEDLGLVDMVRIRLGGPADVAAADRPTVRERRVENVELAGLLYAARDALQQAGALKAARVHLKLPIAPVYVRGDAAVLEAMISNLLKNGVDAIEAQAHDREAIESLLVRPTIESVISIEASVSGETARIEISDNGRSIADTDLDRLFDAYVVSKPAETGTGLGLAIVRETVSRHQGKIWAEIIPSGGTRFVVELPIAGASKLPTDLRRALSDVQALRASV